MPTYQWKAMTAEGEEVGGAMEAPSEQVVDKRLRESGLYPTEVYGSSKKKLLSDILSKVSSVGRSLPSSLRRLLHQITPTKKPSPPPVRPTTTREVRPPITPPTRPMGNPASRPRLILGGAAAMDWSGSPRDRNRRPERPSTPPFTQGPSGKPSSVFEEGLVPLPSNEYNFNLASQPVGELSLRGTPFGSGGSLIGGPPGGRRPPPPTAPGGEPPDDFYRKVIFAGDRFAAKVRESADGFRDKVKSPGKGLLAGLPRDFAGALEFSKILGSPAAGGLARRTERGFLEREATGEPSWKNWRGRFQAALGRFSQGTQQALEGKDSDAVAGSANILRGVGNIVGMIPGPGGKAAQALALVAEAGLLGAGAMKSFGDKVHKANMQFAEFSPRMARVEAEQEMRDIRLSRDRGQRRAAVARGVAESKSSLERVTAELVDPVWDFGGRVADAGMNYVAGLVDSLRRITAGQDPQWGQAGMWGAEAWAASGQRLRASNRDVATEATHMNFVRDASTNWLSAHGLPARWREDLTRD